MTEKVTELILQFSTPSEDREQQFTKGMERAAVFCLAEIERRKGSRFVLKRTPREFAFIAEVYYPFWLAPFGKVSLVFDGLNVASFRLFYHEIPNAEAFISSANRNSATREAYTAFLSHNLNYFQATEKQEEKIIDGLLTDPDFLQDFKPYLSEAKRIESPPPDTVSLAPALDKSAVLAKNQELEISRTEFTEETKTLSKGMKLLSATTKRYIEAIRNETREVKAEFNKRLEKRKPTVKERVEKIHEQHSRQVTRISKRFDKEIYRLQQEKIRLEKTKALQLSRIERCKTEKETCVVKKDSAGERRWKERLEQHKKKLQRIEKELNDAEERIKAPENAKKLEISRLKAECESRVDEAMWALREIEASRDAKIHIHKQEAEKLEEQTASIISQMNKLVRLREETINQLGKLGIKRKYNKYTLVRMPFYIVSYRTNSKNHYAAFPPSVVNSMRLSVKVKTLGRAKIKHLLVQRSAAITSLINKVPTVVEQNAVFEREINEAGAKVNTMQNENLLESVRVGLERLKEEGWLSEEERETFNQMLVQ